MFICGISVYCIDYDQVPTAYTKCSYKYSISGSRKYDSITVILKQLQWLPMWQKLQFRIISLTYKVLNDIAPQYLSEILTNNQHQKITETLTISMSLRHELRLYSTMPMKILYIIIIVSISLQIRCCGISIARSITEVICKFWSSTYRWN